MDLVVNYPLFTEKKETIFLTALSYMFSKYKEELEKGNNRGHDESRKVLIKFQEIFTDIRTITGTKEEEAEDTYSESALEELAKLASATNIGVHFTELFGLTGYKLSFDIAPLHNLTSKEKEDILKITSYQNNSKPSYSWSS